MPFEMVRNDITRMNVDAIINAANTSLLGGGGVDGAIHRAAGPELLEECRKLNGCRTGEAKITKGYRLPARYVIHTVGPVWHGGARGEQELLAACYRNSLELAREHGCGTVAFPLISAGAYGYPKDQAMSVAVHTISDFLLENEMTVYLVLFGQTEFLTGKKLFRDVREYIDDVYAREHTRRRTELNREQLWHQDEKAALDFDLELSAMPCEAKDAIWEEQELQSSHPSPDQSMKSLRKATGCKENAPRTQARQEPNPGEAVFGNTAPDWEQLLKGTDEGFSDALLRLIGEKGMTDSQCYKKANVDRKLFSKIRSNPAYRPSKPTVFAFAMALELSLPETQRLLYKAGFALSHSSRFDIVMEYFILHRQYNIYEINEVLFQFDMPLLGSGMN